MWQEEVCEWGDESQGHYGCLHVVSSTPVSPWSQAHAGSSSVRLPGSMFELSSAVLSRSVPECRVLRTLCSQSSFGGSWVALKCMCTLGRSWASQNATQRACPALPRWRLAMEAPQALCSHWQLLLAWGALHLENAVFLADPIRCESQWVWICAMSDFSYPSRKTM